MPPTEAARMCAGQTLSRQLCDSSMPSLPADATIDQNIGSDDQWFGMSAGRTYVNVHEVQWMGKMPVLNWWKTVASCQHTLIVQIVAIEETV